MYIYKPGSLPEEPKVGEPSFGTLLFSKSGPIGVIRDGGYYSFVTDPGTIKLWLVGARVAELKLEALAGQIYYVKANFWGAGLGNPVLLTELKLIPRETAMKDMAGLQQLTE